MQKKNLIYLVIILFSVGTTVYLWKKNTVVDPNVQNAGYMMADEGGGGYIEDETAIDSDAKKKDGETVQEGSGIGDADTMELAAKKARDSVRKVNLNYIYSRLLSYYDEHGDTYPISGDRMIKLNDKETGVYKELVPRYVSEEQIKDPNDPAAYFGYKSADGKDFALTAVLENTESKDCIKMNDLCIYKYDSKGVVSGQ